jgi:hypothetical protein
MKWYYLLKAKLIFIIKDIKVYVSGISLFKEKKKEIKKHLPVLIQMPEEHQNHLGISFENLSDSEFYIDLLSFNILKLPEFIKVKINGSEDLHDLLFSIKSEKRIVHGFRYIVNNKDQFKNSIDIKRTTPFGEVNCRHVKPYMYKTAYQGSDYQIDAPSFSFDLNVQTGIGINILPKTKGDFVFLIIDSVNPGRFRELKSGLVQVYK